MPRRPIERSNSNYYHITARSNNKDFFCLPTFEVWNIFCEEIKLLQEKYNVKIPAFVLMDNHFHLLILTPDEGIDRIMYFLMKNTTLKIQKDSNRINRILGGRYKGSIIKSNSHLVNVYKYIYLNPVKANITCKAESYPYSSLYYKRNRKLRLPFHIDDIFKQAFDKLNEEEWINLGFKSNEYLSLKKGLRKTVFSYSKDNSTGKEIVPLAIGAQFKD